VPVKFMATRQKKSKNISRKYSDSFSGPHSHLI
jgi:hypothetical protein